VVCVSNENHVKIANYFKNSRKKVIILSTMSPTLTADLQWADSILLGYSWRCGYTMEALMAVVNGEYVPKGVRPYKD